MILYVMRHAEAVEGSNTLKDDWRYLTEKGRATAAKMSSAISKSGSKARLTVTSPLTRAVQTAEIAAETACRKSRVIASELLLPGADPAALTTYLAECKSAKRVMLVGHEPQLGILIAGLLAQEHATISLKKGSCVALELDPEKHGKPADFIWYLVPGKKKISSFKKAFPHVNHVE